MGADRLAAVAESSSCTNPVIMKHAASDESQDIPAQERVARILGMGYEIVNLKNARGLSEASYAGSSQPACGQPDMYRYDVASKPSDQVAQILYVRHMTAKAIKADPNVNCAPTYSQVYQPPLKLGGSGRVIQVRNGENCKSAMDTTIGHAAKTLEGNLCAEGMSSDSFVPDEQPSNEIVQACLISAMAGNSLSQYYMGRLNHLSYAENSTDEDMMIWYQKSASQGNEHAQLALAGIYSSGLGEIKRDVNKSIYWFQSLKENNSTITNYMGLKSMLFEKAIYTIETTSSSKLQIWLDDNYLAHIHNAFYGSPSTDKEDVNNSINFLESEAESGNFFAKRQLAQMKIHGVILQKNVEGGLADLKFLGDVEKDPTAYGILAGLYREGLVVKKDLQLAEYWEAKMEIASVLAHDLKMQKQNIKR